MRPCVGSGHCCRIPCAYGKYNEEKTQCKYLEIIKNIYNINIYKCSKYEEIKKTAPGWEIYPAFGAGCCQPIANQNRESILKLAREGHINLPIHDGK